MLIIILTIVHIIGVENHLNPRILHIIIHPLFFLVAYAHMAISTSKAFITLGFGNAKTIKVVDIIMIIIGVILFIISTVGLYFVLFRSWQG